ncbi:hypothetical protein [Streptomyces sp. SID2563]|nr:hypothetical protein [Streptomyces sp. SID2563]
MENLVWDMDVKHLRHDGDMAILGPWLDRISAKTGARDPSGTGQ